jgi:TonB family protein
MKILILLLSASLFLSTLFQAQQSPELKEATELTDSVVKLFNQQKFDEALLLAKRALQIREKLLPPTDPLVVTSLTYLGDVYVAKGDTYSAKKIFERLLPIAEERTDTTLALTLDRLAVLYRQEGSMSKAENMFQRALAVREKAFGPEDVKVAGSVLALAQFYRFRKDYDRALPGYKRVLAIYGKANVPAPELERAMVGFHCLAYESKDQEVYKELEEIRKQYSLSAALAEPPQIINGKAISLGRPSYPWGARVRSLSGTVYVLVEIDETGKVIKARDMCQGPPYLSEAAVNAAFQSRFTPTKLSGMPVKVKGVITYNFVNQGPTFR